MPKTWWAMLIGGLALAGIPPLSGFFAKDSILASALAAGTGTATILFAVGIAGTFLTGLYTFRMLFVVFGGEQSAYVQEHPPHAHHDRLVAVVDGPDRRRARRARRVRRLDPVRERVDADHRLARAGREAARRGDRARRRRSRASSRSLVGRGRDRRRLVDLLGAPARRRRSRGRSSSTSSTSTSCTTGSSTGRPSGSPASSAGRRRADHRRLDPRRLDRRARGGGRGPRSSRPASSAPTPSRSPPASPSSSSSSSRSRVTTPTAGSPPR